VGSFPRPEYLISALSERQQGKISQEEFDEILDLAIRSIVKLQVETGIDEINDGEYSRLVYFSDITGLKGFTQNAVPLDFSAGDVYRTPILTGRIEYDKKNPLIAKEVKRVKGNLERLEVKRKVKVTVPSPSHMKLFYPDPNSPLIPPQFKPQVKAAYERIREFYPSLDDYVDEIKSIVINEVDAAFKAGADVVQFDSPDLSFSTDIQEAVDLNNSVISRFPPEKLELHICWGNYENTQIKTSGSFRDLLPTLYGLKAGTLGPLEIFDGLRDYKELEAFKEYPPSTQRLCAGIVSVKTRNVEPVEALKQRYLALVEIVGPERAVASPGCGFASAGASKIISFESAKRKLSNLVQAVRDIRKE
jgi:5-methyltetrahydropteroyltriglutamate--homocysteine methyltransferase